MLDAAAPKKTRRRAEPDRSWVEPLLEAAKALRSRRLDSLSSEERHLVARVFAARFANCAANQATNIAKATSVAASMAATAHDRRLDALTVGECLALSKQTWERGGKRPIWSVWRAVMASVEYEAT